MWHQVSYVAHVRGFDEADFIKFSLDNMEKYHIVHEYFIPEVNTWNVDALINDYKRKRENDSVSGEQPLRHDDDSD